MRGDRPGIGIDLVSFNWFTPHARGSTWEPTALQPHVNVYPACAGIDLRQSVMLSNSRRLPRMRGDRPRFSRSFEASDPFTPHAGIDRKNPANCNSGGVYPHAGIDHDRRGHGPGGEFTRMRDRPQAIGQIHLTQSLPACADRPVISMRFMPCRVYPRGGSTCCHVVHRTRSGLPHAGIDPAYAAIASYVQVYPACAGIDLVSCKARSVYFCLPRMRGDRPGGDVATPVEIVFTPHARGST